MLWGMKMKIIFKAENAEFANIIKYPPIEIEEKKATFICGDSGSGKSTFLKLLNGTISPTSGDIFYFGRNINTMDTIQLRKEVMLCGQSVFLFDGTIRENFKEFYEYRGLKSPDEKTIKTFLSLCNANFLIDSNCSFMSGGERQRVYIALFLSFKPNVLMLDEPTSALDTANAEILLNNIKKFCMENDMTLIVVSHDSKLTQKFADRIITIEGKNENGNS